MRDMATGMELRLERTAARVTLKELSARMGRHPATLHRWELAARVKPPQVAEYREALATFADDATTLQAA